MVHMNSLITPVGVTFAKNYNAQLQNVHLHGTKWGWGQVSQTGYRSHELKDLSFAFSWDLLIIRNTENNSWLIL